MKASEISTLKSLVLKLPVAALSTLHNGLPAVSMVPFATLRDSAQFVIHVSSLASHTRDMLANPAVALLITAPLEVAETPLALPRVSIQGCARPCGPEASDYAEARTSYLAKIPEAEELFSFTDFSLFIIKAESLRFVAGFGRAMSLTPELLQTVLLD